MEDSKEKRGIGTLRRSSLKEKPGSFSLKKR
jgi:hypothetical protein